MSVRPTLQSSLAVGVGAAILALTGILNTFRQLSVIPTVLTLDVVLVVLLLVGVGVWVGGRARAAVAATATPVLHGALGGLVVAGVLAAILPVLFTLGGVLRAWVRFTFPNVTATLRNTLTLSQPNPLIGLVYLALAATLLGALGGLLALMAPRWRTLLLSSLGITVILGLLGAQLVNVLGLNDAIALVGVVVLGYVVGVARWPRPWMRALVGLLVIVAAGGLLFVLGQQGVFTANTIGNTARVLTQPLSALLLIFGGAGLLGALGSVAAPTAHSILGTFVLLLLALGVLNQQRAMTVTAAAFTTGLWALGGLVLPRLRARAARAGAALGAPSRALAQQGVVGLLLVVMLIAPAFVGQNITYVLALVGIYVIMGIGLNVIVGYAGMLSLGHVGFFAIGAYTVGLLTTPSMATCGFTPPSQLTPELIASQCTVLNFWVALALAVVISALAGVVLGIPVLRLRGDYLAIVTLGFAEIIGLLVLSSVLRDWFGGAQGLSPIPSPTINLTFLNPAWQFTLFSSRVYYLVVPGILIAAYVAARLLDSRLGRAWRAIRADETVAQAMGINLVRSKLAAFAVGSACAGLAGALFGSGLQGAFPNSFTLLVSINVLSMIIIGGLGSLPGVLVGGLMLYGLPEVLRELQDYRLLAFGVLLVVAMLVRPEGLLPPPLRRLSAERQAAQPLAQASRDETAPHGLGD